MLDFGELDIDYLADDSLDKDELEFTELDYDALNVNFLEDLLDIITELDVLDNEEELTQTISAVNIEGTKYRSRPKNTDNNSSFRSRNKTYKRSCTINIYTNR